MPRFARQQSIGQRQRVDSANCPLISSIAAPASPCRCGACGMPGWSWRSVRTASAICGRPTAAATCWSARCCSPGAPASAMTRISAWLGTRPRFGGAHALGLHHYGLDVGRQADVVLVPVPTVAEAVVAHPPRSSSSVAWSSGACGDRTSARARDDVCHAADAGLERVARPVHSALIRRIAHVRQEPIAGFRVRVDHGIVADRPLASGAQNVIVRQPATDH